MKIEHGAEPARRRDLDHSLAADPGAEIDERIEVGIEPAAADRVATRRRHPDLTEARKQRPREQKGGPDPGGEVLVHGVIAEGRGPQPQVVRAEPLDLDAHRLEQPQLGLDVADPGTLRRVTSSSVSRQAASSGRAAFLFPAATISPESGTPPWMTNFSKAGLE